MIATMHTMLCMPVDSMTLLTVQNGGDGVFSFPRADRSCNQKPSIVHLTATIVSHDLKATRTTSTRNGKIQKIFCALKIGPRRLDEFIL